MEKIEVDGKSFEVVESFVVLHEGWELDNSGWIVKKGSGKALVLSDHGVKYFAKNRELEDKLKEMRQNAAALKRALNILYGNHSGKKND